ncbi:transmembrane protein 220 [Rhinophrynus dorsalis]
MEDTDRNPKPSSAQNQLISCLFSAQNRERLWRFCHFIMFVFFSLAAYVQVNDPDSELWIVIYTVPAILILLVSISPDITGHIIWKTLAQLHSVVCVMGILYLSWYLFIHSKKSILHEEEGRELSGLLIIVTWMLLSRETGKQKVGGIRLFIAASISLFPFLVWLYIYINEEMRRSWPQHCKTVI